MNLDDVYSKREEILIKIIKIGILIILFLPLVVGSKFFFPFIVLKNTLFRIIVEVIFFLYLILVLKDKRFRPSLNSLTIAVIIFFAIVTLTTFTGIGIYRGFWSNYERMGGLVRLWHLFLFFIVLIGVFKEKKDWYSFFSFSIFASILMSLFALAQRLNVPFLLQSSGGGRVTGTIGNPTYLAAYILINLFFILYFIFRDKEFDIKLFVLSLIGIDLFIVFYDLYTQNFVQGVNSPSLFSQLAESKQFFLAIIIFHVLTIGSWFLQKKKHILKLFLITLFIFEFLIFFWTQTRGAIVGLFISLLFILFASTLKVNSKIFKKISLIVLIILIISPLLLYFCRNLEIIKSNETLNRLASTSLKSLTVESRLLTWQASWRGWIENPIRFLIGFGQENYYYVFNRYFPSEIFKDVGSRIWFDRAHNIIFDTGITSGLIGLISYLSIFILVFYLLWKRFKVTNEFETTFIFLALLIAYFIQNIFVFDTLNTYILFILILGFIVIVTRELQISKMQLIVAKFRNILLHFLPRKKVGFTVIGILGVMLIVAIYSYNIRLLKANNYIYKAIKLPVSQLEDKKLLFEKAINEAVAGKFEARQQLADLAISLIQNKDAPQDKSLPIIKYAISELEKSIAEEPLNVRHYLFLGGVYNKAYLIDRVYLDKAIKVLNKAVALSPSRPQIYFELGQAYFIKGDIVKGLEYFEKGVEYSPKVKESNFDLVKAYIMAGQKEKALQRYEYMKNNVRLLTLSDCQRLINAAEKSKMYELVVLFYQDLIERYPSDTMNYAGLAAAYAAIGENDRAEEMVQKVLELNPGYKDKAEIFLKDLKDGKLLKK